MGLKRVDENDVRMTAKEFERWNQSACKGCKAFNGFYTEDGYPVYYNCKAHNVTGYDFVREMPRYGCSFAQRVSQDMMNEEE